MLTPYNESRGPSRPESVSSADGFTTQTVVQRFAIIPDETLIIHPEEIEQDDDLHNPDTLEKDRDFRIWTKRGAVNVGGLALVMFGLLTLFIASPIMWVDLPLKRGMRAES